MKTEERLCLGGESDLEVAVKEVVDSEDGRAGVEAPKHVPNRGVCGEASFHHLIEGPQVHSQPQLEFLVGARGFSYPLYRRSTTRMAGKWFDDSLFD